MIFAVLLKSCRSASKSWWSGRYRLRDQRRGLFALVWLVFIHWAVGQSIPPQVAWPAPGIEYKNYRVASVPWSVHVVKVSLTNTLFEIHSMHADALAVGLETLSEQTRHVNPALGTPVAAINGDFYQRHNTFAGNSRGLQIIDGELYRAPSGSVSFWMDRQGQPHAANVVSLFQVIWPNGTRTPFGLNEDRQPNAVVLYTSAVGRSTHTRGGRELVLEQEGAGPWSPLRIAEIYTARVSAIQNAGNTPLTTGIMVLSLGPALLRDLPLLETGAVLRLSVASSPSLRGAKTALSGGPVLVHEGKRQKISTFDSESYEFSSMLERHPRAAVGWNKLNLFLVEVDGRQRALSVGMTLDELAAYMIKLGCEEAMNFDGGGSATLWYNGRVRNSPCDGHERVIANSLVVVQKNPESLKQ